MRELNARTCIDMMSPLCCSGLAFSAVKSGGAGKEVSSLYCTYSAEGMAVLSMEREAHACVGRVKQFQRLGGAVKLLFLYLCGGN